MKDFLNRLVKNSKELSKWSKRSGVTVYRVYDRDIPQFPFIVDVLGDWVVLASLARDPALTEALGESAGEIAGLLGVPADRVVFRKRERQKGVRQYEKSDEAPLIDTVTDNGLRFELNLTQYLDIGLFIDHRKTRAALQSFVNDQKCLNLFCYTGAVSAAMASGGAAQVDSIDMSKTYLEWARRNFELNGLLRTGGERFQFFQEDVLSWLKEQVRLRRTSASLQHSSYDVIFVDPPSFSNSKRMDGTFDVQRDHAWLLEHLALLLNPNGLLLFSNNRTGFKLDPAVLKGFFQKQTTELTHGRDFKSRYAHKSFVFSPSEERGKAFVSVLTRLGPDF